MNMQCVFALISTDSEMFLKQQKINIDMDIKIDN